MQSSTKHKLKIKKKNTCKEKQINLDSTCVLFVTVIIMFCIFFPYCIVLFEMDVFSFCPSFIVSVLLKFVYDTF